MNVEQIARVAHETNKAFCETIGDLTQKPWPEAEQWQRDSAIKGVEFLIANPQAPASATHDDWVRQKEADGWKFGEVKDPIAKTHPCMVPYEELPIEQRLKDYLLRHIVLAFVEAGAE